MNDHGMYDAPAPIVRRAKHDFDGLHHILGDHREDTSQTQREISVEAFYEGRKGATIAARHAISVSTCDAHRGAGFGTRRDSITTAADFSSTIDLREWYGRIEEMSKRHAARQWRRASCKKENRSKFKGDRSKFEGDRCKSRGDLEKNARARDISVAVSTKS